MLSLECEYDKVRLQEDY